MLARRLPPARAGGAPGDDADSGRGDRRRVGRRRDRAAALRHDRAHAAARDRGREPRPRPRHRPRQPPGPRADGRPARDAPIEPLVRDAPIVPETKPLDDLLAELQRQRTAMAVVVDEYGRVAGIVTRRGHHRGGRGGDRGRDRPGRRRGAPAGQRRLVRARRRRRSPTWSTTASSCRWTPTPTTRSAGFVFADARAAAASAATRHRQRLLDPRRVRAREPHRGRADSRAHARHARLSRIGASSRATGTFRMSRPPRAHVHRVVDDATSAVDEERGRRVRTRREHEPRPARGRRAGRVLLGGGAAMRCVASGSIGSAPQAALKGP